MMADPAGLVQTSVRDENPPCCCGRFAHLSEPVGINDTVHEPSGPERNFCGYFKDHTIRNLLERIKQLEAVSAPKSKEPAP